MQITLRNLPKISLNEWYSSTHWTKRKKIKDNYKLIVRSQFRGVLSKKHQYTTDYTFLFKSRPLDASNCVAMLKMIEDIIFENDKFDIIRKISISSHKSNEDKVIIKVEML